MGCHTWFYQKGYKREHRLRMSEYNIKFPLRIRVNNEWYVEAVRPAFTAHPYYYHDLFRSTGGCQEVVLKSKEETLTYIKENGILFVEWDDLNEFWELNPNGAINFG